MTKMQRYSKQIDIAMKIYQALGPGPWTVTQAEEVLNMKRIGPIMGSLRESRIVVHHGGSQLPMVRRRGEERTPPTWCFTETAIKTFNRWIRQEEEELEP